METPAQRHTLLVELEAMQNDLLERLDDLDRRVCLVLKQWNACRESIGPADLRVVSADDQPAMVVSLPTASRESHAA